MTDSLTSENRCIQSGWPKSECRHCIVDVQSAKIDELERECTRLRNELGEAIGDRIEAQEHLRGLLSGDQPAEPFRAPPPSSQSPEPIAMMRLALAAGVTDPRFRRTCDDLVFLCESQARRIAELEQCLKRINAINDDPARFDAEIDELSKVTT